MKLLSRLSLQNKIFFASVAVILFVSVGIALVARWVLVSSLINRAEQRGVGIAQSVAAKSAVYVQEKNSKALSELLFDASHLGNREALIAYMFVKNAAGRVLAHTFNEGFPKERHQHSAVQWKQDYGIMQVSFGDESAYDISFPLKSGEKSLGTVHVGLSKTQIDEIVGRLRITFLGFISVIILIFFGIARWLSGYITKPMGELIQKANEISRGNFDMGPVYDDSGVKAGRTLRGDEIEQMSRAFSRMTVSLRSSQAKLRDSEEKYRSLFYSGPNPVFVVSRGRHVILDANPAASEAYGYPHEELIGRPFEDLGTFDHGNMKIDASGKEDLADVCVLTSRVRHFKKGHRPFYVNVRACPGIYQGRHVLVLATSDVTDIMEKDAQLIQASKMKSLGEMSAGIAHEVNQPLNAIKMGNDFLMLMLEKGRAITPEKLAQVVKEVSAQVNRASEIINRLRAFARKADFSREEIPVTQPVSNVVKILEEQLKLQNIVIRFIPQKETAPVMASNNRLEQVFFNLLINARDAVMSKADIRGSSVCGIIGIRAFSKGNEAVISVSDTGPGISGQDRDKIFEPFFTTKEVGKGMGLGLAIVYEIVLEHGGNIRLHSGPGIGTTFAVILPRIPDSKGEINA